VIGGLALLVEQAIFQIQYFSGIKFDQAQMREELLKVGRAAIGR
jgi:shikimate dehydrogenase